MCQKIISGGQLGADLGGLLGAIKIGLKTGGWMPAGYRTEIGSRPEIAKVFGLKCTAQGAYWQRTQFNIRDSDATVIIGNVKSRGSALTEKMCNNMKKPCLLIDNNNTLEEAVVKLKDFVKENKVIVLNVAGNRESVTPGIQKFVSNIIEKALRSE